MRRRTAIFGMAALLIGLLAIGAIFAASMAAASRHFDRAAAAQVQLATVSQIEAMALGKTHDRAGLDILLIDYRRSIDRETAIIGTPTSPGQRREATEAGALAALVHSPNSAGRVRALIAQIAYRERGEAHAVAAEMHLLRQRMVTLAILLTGGAASFALAGGWALLAANRKLEREVERRTTDLADSNARLVEIDRSRRLFFAKTGHELRTPITALRGEAEVALANPVPTVAGHRQALVDIGVQAELLGRRVEELLALARADEGKVELSNTAIDLSSLVAEAADLAALHLRSADIALVVTTPEGPTPLLGDTKWLVQALTAIIDNGVKFAPSGSQLTLLAQRDGETATIAISDSGPGVLPPELPRVFDAYYQTAQGASRGGSGLGLALARWVVEQHGGSIAARNDSPGCTILLTLPVAA